MHQDFKKFRCGAGGSTWDEKENPNTNERIGITKTYRRKRAKVHPTGNSSQHQYFIGR